MSKTSANLLKLNSGVANHDQIVNDITKALKSHKRGQRHGQFVVNVVERDGKKVGYSYVWFEKPEIASLFLSHKIQIPDMDWIPPPPPKELTIEELMKRDKGKSWADLTEEEDEEERLRTRPIIEKEIGPAIVMPHYSLTNESRKELHDQLIAGEIYRGRWKEGMMIEVPQVGRYSFERVTASSLRSNQNPIVLAASNVPNWINENDLKMYFLPYVTDNKTRITRKVDGRQIHDTYPFVNINRAIGKVFITFDPKTNDAQFARLMSRKVEFTKGDKSCLLFFDHSRSK